jgi:hypothetical protein
LMELELCWELGYYSCDEILVDKLPNNMCKSCCEHSY